MMTPIPPHLNNYYNEKVLKHIVGHSCHGDIIEPLEKYLKKYPSVQSFCPDPVSFRYVFWYYEYRIFAFGINMSFVSLLLPDISEQEKMDYGLVPIPEAGEHWYDIEWNSVHLEKLAARSFEAVFEKN